MVISGKNFEAGDVIRYAGGGLDYLISIPGEDGLFINACSPSWISRGLRTFCYECYPFGQCDAQDCEVVGHFGNGDSASARLWYEEHSEDYRA